MLEKLRNNKHVKQYVSLLKVVGTGVLGLFLGLLAFGAVVGTLVSVFNGAAFLVVIGVVVTILLTTGAVQLLGLCSEMIEERS